jgi:hypothetical protein
MEEDRLSTEMFLKEPLRELLETTAQTAQATAARLERLIRVLKSDGRLTSEDIAKLNP